MLKTEKKLIDGEEYELTAMDGMRQMKLYPRLAGIIGPVLDQLSSVTSLDGLDTSTIGDALSAMALKLTDDELEKILRDMLFSLRKNGKDASSTGGKFGLEMSGQTMTVWKLLFWAFEVNYGDFLDAGRGMLAKAPRPAALPSK